MRDGAGSRQSGRVVRLLTGSGLDVLLIGLGALAVVQLRRYDAAGSNDSEIVQREVFGPVLTFQTFADEQEAVALANSTRYGLSGMVYTGSEERAGRVGRAVRAGTVWVNTFLVRDLTAPFGGVGISGIGREGGDYALDFYSDLKTLQILDGTTA